MKYFNLLIAILAMFSILACGDDSSKSENTDTDVIVDIDGDETPSNDEDKKPVVDEDKDDKPVVDEDKDDDKPVVDEDKDEEPVVDEDSEEETDDDVVVVVDPCKDVTCGGNGTCSVENDAAECTCEAGFILDKDNALNCIADPCKDVDCGGHGTCSVVDNAAKCACDTDFTNDPADALICIEDYKFANSDFEVWEKATISVPKYDDNGLVLDDNGEPVMEDMEIDVPTGWTIGSKTMPSKVEKEKDSNDFVLGLGAGDYDHNEPLLVSPEVECGAKAPKKITFMMKGYGKMLAKITVGPKATADRFEAEPATTIVRNYKLNKDTRVFNFLDKEIPGYSDYVLYGTYSNQVWQKYSIFINDELNDAWKDGNVMTLTLVSGTSRSLTAMIDSFDITHIGPECNDNTQCTDAEKPICNTNPDDDSFLNCIAVPPCDGKTIKDIKQENGYTIGETVTICEAVLTTDRLGNSKNAAYVMDSDGGDFSGVYLYDSKKTAFTAEETGSKVRITGKYQSNYGGPLQMNVTSIMILPGKATVTPVETTTTDCQNEKLKDMLVTIKNVSVVNTDEHNGKNYGSIELDDALQVSMTAYIMPKPFVGDTISSITGIIKKKGSTWQIMPRNAEDIVMSESPCKDQTCDGHGTCTVENSTGKCTCVEGFENPADDALKCVEKAVDPCADVTCGGHGTCAVVNEAAACTCEEGFENDANDALNCVEKVVVELKDPFISEYVEGSSYNKVLEIYNPNDSEFSLEGFSIRATTNTGTVYNKLITFTADNKIAAKDVFVVAHAQAAQGFLDHADLTNGGIPWNGDDSVALFKGEDIIDVIGIPNPGSKIYGDVTLVRNADIAEGNTTYDENEWTDKGIDNSEFIGSHTVNSGNTPAPAGTPIISEVVKAKAGIKDASFIEIYNPTDSEIDLTGYKLKTSDSIDELDDTQNLPAAKIAAGATIVFSKEFFPVLLP